MANQAYGYTLWKRRPRSLLGDKQVAGGRSSYFDLADASAMKTALTTLVQKHDARGDGGGDYWLELLDPVTGETVRKIEPLEPVADRTLIFSLENVSDEMLIRELTRRLALR